MLTVKEVAEKLSISRSLAYRMIRNGEIASYRIASCRRVSEEELQRYLERTRVTEKQQVLPDAKGRHFQPASLGSRGSVPGDYRLGKPSPLSGGP